MSRRNSGEEEIFRQRGSRRAAPWKNSGRKEQATTNALHLILRVVIGETVGEEEEGVKVETEEVERKAEVGGEEGGGAEEVEEDEGGKRKKYSRGKHSLPNQSLSLTS